MQNLDTLWQNRNSKGFVIERNTERQIMKKGSSAKICPNAQNLKANRTNTSAVMIWNAII